MTEEEIKGVAQLLRKPEGEYATLIGEKMNDGNRLINMHTIDALNLTAGNQVLEIGMGNGLFVKNILSAEASIHYTGCDYSEAMIEAASSHNNEHIKNERAQFHLSDISNLPLQDAIYDKAFTVNTIYFWEDHQVALSELMRVLKPGGQLLISIRPKSNMEHFPVTKYGFNTFSKEDIIQLLSENGFENIQTIEREEPEQDVFGEMVKVETLIVIGEKSRN